MKYYIIPNSDIAAEIDAENKEDAIEEFAATMDSDMNAYFRVVTEEEYKTDILRRNWDGYKTTVLDFMEQVAIDDFDVPEEDARDVAERGFDIYSDEQGTEYECIEIAVEKYYSGD